MSPKSGFLQFLERSTEWEAMVFTVGCWHIWEARNDARNNRNAHEPKGTTSKISAYVDMIVQFCFKEKLVTGVSHINLSSGLHHHQA
jgi:hypothetical protein